MKLKQDILFDGSGLNTDEAQRYLPLGDSPYRLHCMVGEDGENGVITNMRGCEQVVLPTNISFTSSEVYSVVGSFYNIARRECYYFIYSIPYDSGGGVYKYDNKLLRYKADTGVIELVFLDEGNYLGLSHDTLMRDIRMIETWLFFNPKGTEPKMIDVDMAYNYANNDAYNASLSYVTGDVRTFKGGLFYANQAVDVGHTPSTHTAKWDRIGSCYSGESYFGQNEFDFCFDVIKQPPVKRLAFNYGTEPYYAAGYGANNVKGRVFKFAYRYQYHDSAYSVFSAHSAPSLPPDGEVYNGEVIGTSTTNNHIIFQVPLGLPAIIKAVDLVFQEGEGDWHIATTIDRRQQSLLDDEVQEYKFYNNEAYSSIDNTLPEVVYHAVPREAGCQEVINLNNLLYGRCKEGFDSLEEEDMDITLTPVATELVDTYDIDTLLRDNGTVVGETGTGQWSVELDPGNVEGEPDLYSSVLSLDGATGLPLSAGDIFTIVLDGKRHSYDLKLADVADEEALAEALEEFFTYKVGSTYAPLAYESSGVWYVALRSDEYYPQVSECSFYTPLTSSALFAKQRGFKTGAKHSFCIYYYDKNLRRSDANVSEDSTVYVPQFVEDDDVTGVNFKYSIGWEVDHTPPSEARYWRWGKAKNSLADYFVQYIVSDFDDDADFDLSYFDITPLQTIKTTTTAGWNQFANSIIDEYVWEKGDRVRVLTQENDPGGADAIGDLVDRIYDYEIVKYDDDLMRIYIQKEVDDDSFGVNSLVEIYRPRAATASDIYYEFGPLMPIIEDSVGERVHGGVIQNQDTGTDVPATGVFTTGDVYHIMRTPSKPLLTGAPTTGIFHESMHYSDFYVSDYWDRGKIGYIGRIGEQTLNIIRYSNVYVQNTQINGLSVFEPLRYKELNNIYGELRAMREVGDTLKVYQDVKAASILIGRQEYTDSAGNAQVVTSDRVLGSIRYSEAGHGTINPESILKNNRYVYGWDIYNGVVWRDSANGVFPISGRFESVNGRGSYKMDTYFKEKAKALIESGVENVKVMTVWDERYGLLYITFTDKANTDNNDTVVFHEGSNRWITFVDFSKQSTWNEALFPVYSVERGFLNGINPVFNEDDGFTSFDLETGANQTTEATFPTLTIAALPVTVISSPTVAMGLQALTLTPLPVTVQISYVDIFPAAHTWGSAQSGSGVAVEFTVDSPLGGTITAKPSWITIKRQSGLTIGVGDAVSDDEVLDIYPSTANTGSLRSGSFTVTDSVGNSDSATLSQSATTVVTVSVLAARTTEPFTISSASGSGTAGSADVSVTFTPNDSLSNPSEEFTCYYSILKNGSAAGSGSFTATNQEANTETLTMTSTASGGDGITVYLANEEIT